MSKCGKYVKVNSPKECCKKCSNEVSGTTSLEVTFGDTGTTVATIEVSWVKNCKLKNLCIPDFTFTVPDIEGVNNLITSPSTPLPEIIRPNQIDTFFATFEQNNIGFVQVRTDGSIAFVRTADGFIPNSQATVLGTCLTYQ